MKYSEANIFIALIFQSCASFKEPKINGTLNENNLSQLNGQYNDSVSSGGGLYVKKLSDVLDRNVNMFDFKHDEKYVGKGITVDLKVVSKNMLNVKFKKHNQIISDKNVKVKLKNDGFLYVKGKKFMIDFVPFVLGGWNVQKSRLTLNSDGNLYVESNYFFYAALFTVIGDWKTLRYESTFDKKE
ncbi:hypothetical protein EDL99_01550 [Ornithobacterium rhinotracheale]|uniref:hypothetical protein n=1 Tax=Ornithobacterium rhinotracheale TaxID=28251 RepID=UPI00129CE132|nr:hypothetical protein [Ornithobacterium rhinotracheale]MRJ07572.1 hypothetical protein [Ornithobacterium rhinotracheale]UOH78171.1 hypothetical protein MT996_01560 [Ornithobacterium rhinotracheale]